MFTKVSQLMSQPALVCQVGDSLHETAKLMWDRDCGVLPVVDPAGHVIGMITDRDICMALYMQGHPIHAIAVASVMSRTVHACRPDDSVEAAEKLMRDNQVRRLPVIDESGHPVGLLSLNDLARASAKAGGQERDGLSAAHVASTLAAICAPHLPAVPPRA